MRADDIPRVLRQDSWREMVIMNYSRESLHIANRVAVLSLITRQLIELSPGVCVWAQGELAPLFVTDNLQ